MRPYSSVNIHARCLILLDTLRARSHRGRDGYHNQVLAIWSSDIRGHGAHRLLRDELHEGTLDSVPTFVRNDSADAYLAMHWNGEKRGNDCKKATLCTTTEL